MSDGLRFISACIEAGSQMAFRRSLPAWFTAEETRLFTFVQRHLSLHTRMPSPDTLRENGYNLARVHETVEYYTQRLQDRAVFTQIAALNTEYATALREKNSVALLDVISRMHNAGRAVSPNRAMTTMVDQTSQIMEQYRQTQRQFGLLGVTLGWQLVDDLTDGGQAGDVIVIVGRPGLGKTWTLLHMMREAWLNGCTPFIASMEMNGDAIARRILGMHAGVNPQFIRNGRMSTHAHGLVVQTVERMDDMPPLHIMTGNFEKSASDVDKAIQDCAPDAAYVDAGYLISPDKSKRGRGQSRRELIADVIGDLKRVAVDRGIPLVTSVQFNRQVKRKQKGELDLSDIGETDVIPQIASIVLGMRYGDTPYALTRRRIEMMKNREGREAKFEINFTHSPPDFSYVRTLADDDEEAPAADLRHMA